jgi:hypothetical protein
MIRHLVIIARRELSRTVDSDTIKLSVSQSSRPKEALILVTLKNKK